MKVREYTKEDIGKTIKRMLSNLHKNKLQIYAARSAYHDVLEAKVEGAEEVLKALQRKYFKEQK